MSETPLPYTLVDDPDLDAGAEGSRPRRRSNSASRPVSAFAPTRGSRPPPPAEASPLSHEDCDFVTALHEANVALELDGLELTRAARFLRGEHKPARRIDLLEAYYAADGDPILSQRRKATDRWFVYGVEEALHATELVHRLLSVTPELGSARLELIGGSDGPLILRAGEHVCGLEDDRIDDMGRLTVSVRDVVRAFNVLLDRHGVRTRLVGLFGDGVREAYFGQASMGSAIALANAQYLDAPDAETLMQRTAW